MNNLESLSKYIYVRFLYFKILCHFDMKIIKLIKYVLGTKNLLNVTSTKTGVHFFRYTFCLFCFYFFLFLLSELTFSSIYITSATYCFSFFNKISYIFQFYAFNNQVSTYYNLLSSRAFIKLNTYRFCRFFLSMLYDI